MSSDGSSVALAALLDGFALLQGQVAALTQSNARIEDAQRAILLRLDTVDTGQAAVTDILPILETILGRVIDDRERTDAGYQSVLKVMGAIAEGHSGAREEIEAVAGVLEAISDDVKTAHVASVEGFGRLVPMVDAFGKDARGDREAIHGAFSRLAPGIEQLLAAHPARQEGGGGGSPDFGSVVSQILANQVEDRKLNRAGFTKASSMAAFGYAAASGHRGSLPIEVEDDPLLEMYLLAQPADLGSKERALVEWRGVATDQGTAQLIAILRGQYQPSPTDTPATRIMRYRMAAITRATIKGRGAEPPAPPASTKASDRSAAACMIRSQELAQLWRAGESVALYAEPELAGALDLIGLADRRVGPIPEDQTSPELVALHVELATQIESGRRPSLADAGSLLPTARAISAEPGMDR